MFLRPPGKGGVRAFARTVPTRGHFANGRATNRKDESRPRFAAIQL
jgi:hypothetical protein